MVKMKTYEITAYFLIEDEKNPIEAINEWLKTISECENPASEFNRIVEVKLLQS
jgi:hypothetical protein